MTKPISLPAMSARDSTLFVADVALPTWAKGIIIRRPPFVALAERFELDMRAIRRMQRLRARYGDGPLLVRNPVRNQAVLFDPIDVERVLEQAPTPFSPASDEKRAALSHFEPDVSLVSTGSQRAERRAFNDGALDSGCAVHRLAAPIVEVVTRESIELLRRAASVGHLDWSQFSEAWFRIVRQVVLGHGARDDHQLTDMIARLRARANWAFAYPKNRALRAAFHQGLAAHLERAEQNSLATVIARMPKAGGSAPTHQVAQWLFAFDPAGMTTFRALALLCVHPDARNRAREEVAAANERSDLSFLRAVVVETLRLYPTTPMVLRQTAEDTEWDRGMLPAGSGILIFAPFFHRDDERLAQAHRFEPERWVGKDPGDAMPFIPFSSGPGVCPARHLVPMMASAFLAPWVEDGRRLKMLQSDRLDSIEPLPGTLDPFTLRFAMPAGG